MPSLATSTPSVVMLRHPGVSLLGRRIHKLFSTPSGSFRVYAGKVVGCVLHETFGHVYVARYDDGDEEELFYEELMPILAREEEGKLQPIPRDVLEYAASHVGAPPGTR